MNKLDDAEKTSLLEITNSNLEIISQFFKFNENDIDTGISLVFKNFNIANKIKNFYASIVSLSKEVDFENLVINFLDESKEIHYKEFKTTYYDVFDFKFIYLCDKDNTFLKLNDLENLDINFYIKGISPLIKKFYLDNILDKHETLDLVKIYSNPNYNDSMKGYAFEKIIIRYFTTKMKFDLSPVHKIELSGHCLGNTIFEFNYYSSKLKNLKGTESLLLVPTKINEKKFDCYIFRKDENNGYSIYFIQISRQEKRDVVTNKIFKKCYKDWFKKLKEEHITINNVYVYYLVGNN
jgi:hypothetical protein